MYSLTECATYQSPIKDMDVFSDIVCNLPESYQGHGCILWQSVQLTRVLSRTWMYSLTECVTYQSPIKDMDVFSDIVCNLPESYQGHGCILWQSVQLTRVLLRTWMYSLTECATYQSPIKDMDVFSDRVCNLPESYQGHGCILWQSAQLTRVLSRTWMYSLTECVTYQSPIKDMDVFSDIVCNLPESYQGHGCILWQRV